MWAFSLVLLLAHHYFHSCKTKYMDARFWKQNIKYKIALFVIQKPLIQFRFGIWQTFLSKNSGRQAFITRTRVLHRKVTCVAPATGAGDPRATCVRHTYSRTWTNLVFCNHFQIQTTKIFKFLVLTSWFSCSYWKVENIPSPNDNNHSLKQGPLCKSMQASVSLPTSRGAGQGTQHLRTSPLPFQLLKSEFTLKKKQPMEAKCWQSKPRKWKQNPLK